MPTSTSSLGHVPASSRWEFDAGVTSVFDDMLERSIPGYALMRETVTRLAGRYLRPGSDVVDLGCSRGGAIASLVESHSTIDFIGVEISEPMRAAARDRFRGRQNVSILDLDLRTGYPNAAASVTLSVLTLQFTPIEYRQRILRDAFEHTIPGGALILVEKVLGDSEAINRSLIELYHELKSEHGYSAEEIERKRLALEGVLVPVTARWNVDLLSQAGFSQIDCFWRHLNFAGWLALRSG